jgi:hypothetical protein
MLPDTDVRLTRPEFESLVELSKEADLNAIPREHGHKLARLGFIKKIGVDLRITSAGRLRLMQGG